MELQRDIEFWERFIIVVFITALSALFVLLLVLIASVPYFVRTAAVTKVCLERGFPRAVVTWDFSGYCATLDGTTTVRIEQI